MLCQQHCITTFDQFDMTDDRLDDSLNVLNILNIRFLNYISNLCKSIIPHTNDTFYPLCGAFIWSFCVRLYERRQSEGKAKAG